MTTEPPPVEESLGGELGRAMAEATPAPGTVPTPDWAPVDEGTADDAGDPPDPEQGGTLVPHWAPIPDAA